MSAFVDLFILGTLFALARSGWRRGFVFFAIDLVGFVAAVIAAIRFHEIPSALLDAVGVAPTLASFLGGMAVFVPLILGVAWIGGKLSRAVFRPGVFMTNRALGAAFAAALGAALVTVGVMAVRLAPVPFGLTDFIGRSPLARQLVTWTAPSFRWADGTFDLGLCEQRIGSEAPEICDRPDSMGS